MSSVVIRSATEDDFAAIVALDGASFGLTYDADALADAKLDVSPTSFLVAVEGERIVGATADGPFRMHVPGGELDVPGITWVSVDVTRRRQGILSSLLATQLRAHAERGLLASVLMASEGGIYGRFGFGAASRQTNTSVDRYRARLLAPADVSDVRVLTTHEARPLLPALHERWRTTRPGALSRDERRWQLQLLDRERSRNGASELRHLVHADGYVSYRIKHDWADERPRHQCRIVDYAPITADAHRALWSTLLAMDLVGTIESMVIPDDDPLPLLLADHRQVRRSDLGDGLWVRPLDVAGLLAARRYAVELDTVLEVADPLLGDGRYRLRGGPDGASCERVDVAADVSLGVSVLGATVLGGTRLTTLAAAGLVHGDEAAVRRLDRALLADSAPAHGTSF